MLRENLTIMDQVTTKYPNRKLVQITRPLASFLLLLFVGCLVATGLLVYNFSSCSNVKSQQQKSSCEQTSIGVSVTTEDIHTPADVVTTTLYPTTTIADIGTRTELDPDLDVRLPKSVVPHAYRLTLTPFLQTGNFTFHGKVEILVNVTETTNNITLHADDLFIDTVSVTDVNRQTVSIRDVRSVKSKQFLVIDLDEAIQADNQYYIFIVFKGVLNDLLQGFYRSSYEENNRTRWIAATQFQATDARKCFPCFDEPGLKAKFQISIARLKNMTAISNMRKVKSERRPDHPDYIWDHFEESLPMSTYLVAFVVSDFESISNGNFSIWARKSALGQAHYSLKIGPAILKYYEEFFGIDYPLPKLDMVAIPDFSAGAMENWGLITYREPVLLYQKGVSSRSSLHGIAHVVAHELAHQWFGNLVTPTWWTDLWLNEGFATYVEFLGAYAVEPKWKDPDLFLVSELHGAFGLDALKTSHPISIKVNNPDEVNDIFDRISYSKGASIIRMMQHFLTAEVFHNGLNKYLTSRMYSNADQDDLWRTLTEVGHDSGVLEPEVTVKEIMDTWTLQTGYPLITASYIPENNSVHLEQERFYLHKDNEVDNPPTWWVPITYIDKRNNFRKEWLRKEREKTLNVDHLEPDDWFLINANQTGYYRVNYDMANWHRIIRQLQYPNGHLVFDPKNRAQLLDDALNLAFSGYISYDLALNVTLYLVNEREYVPFKSGLDNLNYLYDMFLRTAHFDKYKAYMLHLIRDHYRELGFRDSGDDDPLTVLSRMDIMGKACLLGMRECIMQAVQQFHNWKNGAYPDNINEISPDLREIIYCTAIADGGQEEWDFAWQRYLNTNVANEKEILLSALSCSKETWILSKYLEWAVTENSGIRKHDCPRVFAAVSQNPIGQDLAYRFLKSTWSRIRSYLGPSSMSLNSIVRTSTAHFNTEEEVNDFKSFVKRNENEFGIALRTAQQSIEQAEANVKWMNRYFNTIVTWLSHVVP
ncbi:hypothetical protein NQ317_005276 [Molorchus minor]|uniref:Aminopeptidase n=1 Tax=Molorchus minor TaxID=1323400 RepID=A0ABQ9JZB8_9CUCU|nr:hypothetical protein NQ317_005276 [Molorchus minor]